MNKPKDGGYIVLEGLERGNRFMTTYRDDGHDYTKGGNGELWYKILGYADTHEEALKIIYPNKGDKEAALFGYMLKMQLKINGIIPINS